ncbi:hypothetical protein LOK49_LG02G01109 [Camellia lanceoleosa]|uniref:Uncharacterized protein n=1 Tax=Camellia lanceoleosa TaxID=1840588 RepID=A0ACC0IPB7_9ERIC|nr:hypothetical protein LOK49_LG02G01109 [Camellia lanceoleosa]
MANGLIWATTVDLARNSERILSLYRQLLQRLNSPDLPLNLAARLAKKAEVNDNNHNSFLYQFCGSTALWHGSG